jgi:hypothetical protein
VVLPAVAEKFILQRNQTLIGQATALLDAASKLGAVDVTSKSMHR